MKIDTEGLEIAVVKGKKVRIVPLFDRGPERRRETHALSEGAPVLITISGVMGKDRVTIPIQKMEGATSVYQNDRAILSVGRSAIVRVERRSGLDRRAQ